MGRTATRLSLLPALFVCQSVFAETSPSVEGVVVDGRTGVRIAGVSVYFGTIDGPHYDATTDPSGQFRIFGMAAGVYGSHFEKAGYVTLFSGGQHAPIKAVRIAAGQDPVRLTVPLEAYARLSGSVVGPEGNPAANIKVSLALLEEITDAQGRFSFSQLAPGAYTLRAFPAAVSGTQPRGEDRVEVQATWYPSVVESRLAEPVIVRGGTILTAT